MKPVKKEETKTKFGGRPEKGDDARTHLVGVYVTANDLKDILDVKKITKQSKSDIVYNRYKKGKFIVVQKFGLSGDELRSLSIANNNLNQIARRLNTEKASQLDKDDRESLKVIGQQLAKIRPE